MAPEIRTVGMVGAGTIGASWASFFARHGLEVMLYDSADAGLQRGLELARANLDALAGFGLLPRPALQTAKDRLVPAGSLAELAAGADFVQEAALERYDVKKEVFAELDAHAAPEVILASSSSGLLITEIQKVMKVPGRALIAHPFNPPHLVPLVELVPGEQTSREALGRAFDFYTGLGKIPVLLKKEVPGHIANRLAAALWREAIDLVASGVADVEDVDKALCAGPGVRWALMGQHMIYHLGGGEGGYRHFIDHVGSTFSEYWKSMRTWPEIPDSAKEAVIGGVEKACAGKSLSELAGRRDEKLVAVLRALYGSA